MAVNKKGLFANRKPSSEIISSGVGNFSNVLGKLEGGIQIGRVKDIILNKSYPNIDSYGGDTAIGTIFFEIQNKLSSKPLIAKPFYSQISSYPLVNELVLIFKLPNKNIGINRSEKSYYYINTISLWNHPHHNAYPNPSSTQSSLPNNNQSYSGTENGLVRKKSSNPSELLLGSPNNASQDTFIEKTNIHPLLPFAGDVIHQGRWGNSIRLGSTAKSANLINGRVNDENDGFLNNWSKNGNNGDPITIIRNGQPSNASNRGWEHITEKIEKDLSSIYLTSYQSIKLTPSSEDYSSYFTAPTLISTYKNPQILLNSNRIVLNANQDSVLIGANDNINLSSNFSVNVNTENLRINANTIKLGSKDAKESVILGDSLHSLLDNLLTSLINMARVMKTNFKYENGEVSVDYEKNQVYASVETTLELIQKDLESILSKNVKTI